MKMIVEYFKKFLSKNAHQNIIFTAHFPVHANSWVMRQFFKFFFASFTALAVFSILGLLFFALIIGVMVSSSDKSYIGKQAVLVVDLSNVYYEQSTESPLAFIQNRSTTSIPGLFDVVSMLEYATKDSAVEGLYIKASRNPNGFGTSDELRNAVEKFRNSGKFVVAYGETIDQKSYYVASAAQEIYCHPNGGLDWSGFAMNYTFFKGLLDKLEIDPQIFYAGKFKSATEPFRVKEMTEPNKVQTTELLNDIYGNFLLYTAKARKLDTASLHALAIHGQIQTATDAREAGLVDGLLYDDQVHSRMQDLLKLDAKDDINFVTLNDYEKGRDFKKKKGEQIALLFAEGEIVDGQSNADAVIASKNYIHHLRKLRLDDDIKAVVLRINSPGGSALASDGIWRELELLKKEKPVVVSMGDYAASGGYYIACAADSIFAEPGTLTGSIGVFGILPNFQQFFNDKLGVTFDGVKTAPYADMGSITRPLTEPEKRMIQASIDTIYNVFKGRVAAGRRLEPAFVDSIAQGHVYTGERAISIKLVDRIGYLQDAVRAAAGMAKLKDYQLVEYPKKKSFIDQLLSSNPMVSLKEKELRKTLGEEQYRLFKQIKSLQSLASGPQTRVLSLPEIY